MSGEIGVPLVVALAVLQEEELVFVGTVDAVAHILRQLVEGVGAGRVDAFGVGPSHEPAFEEGIGNGGAVAAVGHHVPAAGGTALAAALLAVGIVEVGQAQHVAELMDDGGDAVDLDGAGNLRPAVELYGTGAVVQPYAVFPDPLVLAFVVDGIDAAGVGPYQPLVVAAIVGTIAGEDEVDEVDHLVAIAVVESEVHLSVDGVEGGGHQFPGIIELVGIVLAVGQLDGADDIELGFELPVGHVAEVVAHAAGHQVVGQDAFVLLLVEHVAGGGLEVLAREALVIELHEDDQPAEVLSVVAGVGRCGAAESFNAGGSGEVLAVGTGVSADATEEGLFVVGALGGVVGYPWGGLQPAVGESGIDIVAFGVFHDGIAVGGGVVMLVFVAVQADGDGGAVGLSDLDGGGVGRNGVGLARQQEADDHHGDGEEMVASYHVSISFLIW